MALIHLLIVNAVTVLIALISIGYAYKKGWSDQNGISFGINLAFVIYLTGVILISIVVIFEWFYAL